MFTNFRNHFVFVNGERKNNFRWQFTFSFLILFSIFCLAFQQSKVVQIPLIYNQKGSNKEYLLMHYWSKTDSLLLKKSTGVIDRLFIDYIYLLSEAPQSVAVKSLHQMIASYSNNPIVLENLLKLSEKYFFDPNSPVRNEEYYIPVLEKYLGLDIKNSKQKTRAVYQLNLMRKNRINTRATNFSFTLANAVEMELYDINAEYIVLLFANPECPACMTMHNEIKESKIISDLLTKRIRKRPVLKVLNIYTDHDLKSWFNYKSSFPRQWINAYDRTFSVNNNELYDLKAMPTLYLLDKDKKVILKDTSFEIVEKTLSVILKNVN